MLIATCQWHISELLLHLQYIRQVFPLEKPTTKPTKRARKNGRDNKQRWGSLSGFTNTNTSQYQRIANMERPDWITSTDQWKCGACVVEPQRRPAQTPHANNDSIRLYGIDRLRVCATTQPQRLPTNYGNRKRTSACNRTVLTKKITVQKIHLCVRSTKEADLHIGTTSILAPTDGPVDRVWTGLRAPNALTFIYLLQGDRRNQPRGKCGKNDGAIWNCRTPSPFNWAIR